MSRLLTLVLLLWFESQEALDGLKDKNPAIQGVVTEWSDHSSGMHQSLGKLCSSSHSPTDTKQFN